MLGFKLNFFHFPFLRVRVSYETADHHLVIGRNDKNNVLFMRLFVSLLDNIHVVGIQ